MEKEQLKKIINLFGCTRVELGMELGFYADKYQCKQLDNLVDGSSDIKPVVVLALECLARRKSVYPQFIEIMNDK